MRFPISTLLFGAATVAALPAPGGPRSRTDGPLLTLENITEAFQGEERRALSGPQMGKDFPDPSIIKGLDGSWRAYATSSNGKNVPVAVSTDAFTWSLTSTDALPNPGPWVDTVNKAIWAPDVIKNDAGTYVMYYTARRAGGRHCIGIATASTAVGPFKPQSSPFICNDAGGGVIDAAGYDDGVNRWVMWKVDGSALGGATTCAGGSGSGTYYPTPIMIQRVSRDGLRLQGSARKILDHVGANNDGIVEAPTLWKVPGGDYVLFYSAHCYSSDDYDIEYAWSPTIDGAYTDRKILISTGTANGIYGPGHPDVDPNGRNMVFHGRLGPNQGGGGARLMYSATINIGRGGITGL